MELIYFFVGNVNNQEYNVGLNLSRTKAVNYDYTSGKITINNKDDYLPDDFFGRNIKNLTAIIGQNGVGKSSILNLLGYNFFDRNFSYLTNNEDLSWLAIYYIDEKDNYVLEGRNVKIPYEKFVDNSLYFSFYCEQNRSTPFDKYEFLQEVVDGNKYLIEKCKYIFYRKNIMTNVNAYNDDKNFFFERKYIVPNAKKTFYAFLTSNYFKKIFYKKRKIEFSVSIRDIDFTNKFYSKSSLFYNIKQSYNSSSSNKSFNQIQSIIEGLKEVKRNFIIDKYHIISPEKIRNFVGSLSNKQIFILSTLEKAILSTLSEIYCYNDDLDLKLLSFVSEELNNILNPLEYEKYKSSLIKIFDKVAEELNQIQKKLVSEDQLFLIDNLTKKIVPIFETFRSDLFSKKMSRIDVYFYIDNNVYNDDFGDLLEQIDNLLINELFNLNLGKFSDGEKEIINQMACLDYQIKMIPKDTKLVILLIDEFDLHLHPEWQRKYLDYLLRFLEQQQNEIDNFKFQIILSSHSPFIVSDIPRKNIIKLLVENNNKIVAKNATTSFASNFYEILNDSFFIEDNIGEFANLKINNIIERIQNINHSTNMDDMLLLEKEINIIDDLFIKNRLMDMLENKTENMQWVQKRITELQGKLVRLRE